MTAVNTDSIRESVQQLGNVGLDDPSGLVNLLLALQGIIRAIEDLAERQDRLERELTEVAAGMVGRGL